MSTSDEPTPVLESGFTLVELMVGLSIAVCLAAALVSVWLSYQNKGDGEADSTVWYLQARVAAARFERDLRLVAHGAPDLRQARHAAAHTHSVLSCWLLVASC